MTLDESLEALKILQREEFDLLITDLKMKGLKGLDLLEEAGEGSPPDPGHHHHRFRDH